MGVIIYRKFAFYLQEIQMKNVNDFFFNILISQMAQK